MVVPDRLAAAPSRSTDSAIGGLRGWPCAGCLVELPAGYNPSHPPALVVALHGDEGAPDSIASLMSSVTRDRNVILFAPQCPTALGCRLSDAAGSTNSWWGWLQYSRTYDDSWLGRQIARVEARFAINRAREYALGWSGGADYLGWYALRDGGRFAAVAFVAGGVPYVQSCPPTHLAAYFLLGLADPRYLSGQPLAVRSVFESCGDQTRVVTLPGTDHQATMLALETRGLASSVLNWLMQHRRSPSKR
jgi:poly(3-hydroxybutyrate) depolymerase